MRFFKFRSRRKKGGDMASKTIMDGPCQMGITLGAHKKALGVRERSVTLSCGDADSGVRYVSLSHEEGLELYSFLSRHMLHDDNNVLRYAHQPGDGDPSR